MSHLTTPPSAAEALDRLLAIMARLRDPLRGCDWDLAQSFTTIAPYTIEEAYEVADAIERDDMAALKDELGDLLLQVVFHARIAQEAGLFDFTAVAEAISHKMETRHPHIFGDASDLGQTRENRWESLKAAERAAKGAGGVLDGVAEALPALLKAVGYRTIHAGKAHFGAKDTPGEDPKHFGFEVNIAGHAAGGPGSY